MATTLPSVWLDSLPEDVNIRIINFLQLVDCYGNVIPEALMLSQVSDKQARQVMFSMGDTFFLDDVETLNPKDAKSWCSIALPHVRHLRLPEEETPQQALCRSSLFKAPNLESLHTRADAAVLNCIASNPLLRVLDLSGSLCSTSLADHIPLLFKTLSTLNLTALHLDCMSFHPGVIDICENEEEENCSQHWDRCGLEQLLQYDRDPAALGRQCPNVKTFGLRCFHQSERFSLPAFLNGFNKLREFNADFAPLCGDGRQISDTLVAKLQTLDSVHLNYVIGGCSRAADIGAPVKTLQCLLCYRHILDTPEVLDKLSRCPNLEILRLFLTRGAEITLPSTARNIVPLKTLCLTWEMRCQTVFPVPTTGIQRIKRIAEEYHCPAPNIILQTVQHSPKLCRLALFFVRVDIEEIRNVLKTIGKRLRLLALSIRGQEEPPGQRLTMIMEEIARSNRELESFDLDDVEKVKTDDGVKKRRNKSQGSGASPQFTKRRMQKAFGMMRRNTPTVDWESFAEDLLSSYKLNLIASVTDVRAETHHA